MRKSIIVIIFSISLFKFVYSQESLVEILNTEKGDRDVTIYDENILKGTITIYHFHKEGYYDLVKEKWVKEYEAIGGKTYNQALNQYYVYEKFLQRGYVKATKEVKALAKKLGKQNCITEKDSIYSAFSKSFARVYNTNTGNLLYEINEEPKFDSICDSYFYPFQERGLGCKLGKIERTIDGFIYTPNKQYIITYGYELPLRIYYAKTGKLFKTFYTNSVGDSILGKSNRVDTYNSPVYYYPINTGTIDFTFTDDNKYLAYKYRNNDNQFKKSLSLFGGTKYTENIEIFNVESLKFEKPIKDSNGYTYIESYCFNNLVIMNGNPNIGFVGLKHILDSNNYYKFQCNIDSFKNDEVELLPTYDTNCIVVKSTKYQCLWYYKTNRQVFINTYIQPIYDSLLTYIRNSKDAVLSYFIPKKYNFSAYDSSSLIKNLTNYNSIQIGTFYISPSTPLLISQNFTDNYYKIWDISKGVVIDSFLNETRILEMQNNMVENAIRHQYIPMAASLSTNGNIIWVHQYEGVLEYGGSQWTDGESRHYFSDRAIKAYHIKNTKKRYDLEKMMAYSSDETQMLFRVDSSTAEIKDLLTGATLKTITLKGYNLQAAFYSPQKKSFIGVATKNKNKQLYLYIFKDGRILDLNKPCKNVQVLKTLED
jgi:hypothetical protein